MLSGIFTSLFKSKVTDPLAATAKTYVDSATSMANDAWTRMHGEEKSKSQQLIDENRKIANEMAKKYKLDRHVHISPELEEFKKEIQQHIDVLEVEIQKCNESFFSFLQRDKARIKKVKQDALKELLNAKDIGTLRKAIAEQRKNTEVIKGITSRTEKLFDKIDSYRPGHKKKV